MRTLSILIAAAVAVVFAAPAAEATTISVGFSSGKHHPHWRGKHRGHHYHRTHYRPHSYFHYSPRPVIHTTRIVSYAPPPVVQTQYIYAPAPMPQTVVVTPASGSDSYCREYQAAATVGGLPQPAFGTACLQPDGSWKIVK